MNATSIIAQKAKNFEGTSQDGNISVTIEAGNKLQWSVQHKDQQIIAPSAISMQFSNKVIGDKALVSPAPVKKVNAVINTINYKKTAVSGDKEL